MTLERLLSRRLLFVLGPGGAGKTSLAAALGLLAAERGRRALVLTLDPARRLAEALRLAAGERVFSPEELRAAAVAATAPLEAAVFDPRRSWIDLLAREVPDLETRRRLLAHPFFVRLSEDLAGSREYAALAEILAVFRAGSHDLVILDTPPAEHGLDFLDAAERVLAALDADALSWLVPLGLAQRALRLTGWASGYIARTLARFTGAAFLEELGGFLELGSALLPRVRERAAELRALLQSEECGSVLVTRAGEGPAQDALSLWAAVARRARRPEAVVANLLTPHADLPGDAALDPAARAGAERVLSFLAAIAGSEQAALARLREGLPAGATLVRVPAVPGEIVDLAGLARLCRALQRAFSEAS